MKKILFLMLVVFSVQANAQFKTANLQAAGLTCALCSRSINKSLEKLSFVQTVVADIKSSSFNIVFKPGSAVDIDGLKNAVEDAGFSIAKLKMTGSFKNVNVQNDTHVNIDGRSFHFINTGTQVLDGEKTIVLVDRDFVNAKEFKKYSSYTKKDCIQTGKAGNCCKSEGMRENTRVYHVTI